MLTRPQSAATDAGEREDVRERGWFVLSGLTFGHAVFHFLPQSFSVMLPAVKDSLGITPLEVGAIITAREVASGLASLPGGVMSDRLRRYWGVILAVCMGGFGLGWLLVGLSPFYPLLILGMVILSIAMSVWHLPSMAALSERFSRRRGAALAIHGIGGNLGDVAGPMATGVLLGVLTWQRVISIYALVPLLMAALTLWAFWHVGGRRSHGREAPSDPATQGDLKAQMRVTIEVLKNVSLWRINVVAGLRGMCYTVYTTFLPLYFVDELRLSSQAVGFHMALLFSMGIVASPVMGHLSDRLGRKPVLVPMLLGSCLLSIMLPIFGHGIMLTVIVALLGLFLRSDYSLLAAAILDMAGRTMVATLLGVLSFSRFVMAAISPLIAGAIYQTLGIHATLYYVAALFALATLVLVTTNLKAGVPAADAEAS